MTSRGSLGPTAFDVHVSVSNGAMTARLVGELDVVTVPEFKSRIDGLLEDGARELTIDLADLEFIDSTGLSALVAALKRYRADGGDIILRAPTRATTKVLEISGLAQVFSIESGPAGSQ